MMCFFYKKLTTIINFKSILLLMKYTFLMPLSEGLVKTPNLATSRGQSTDHLHFSKLHDIYH